MRVTFTLQRNLHFFLPKKKVSFLVIFLCGKLDLGFEEKLVNTP